MPRCRGIILVKKTLPLLMLCAIPHDDVGIIVGKEETSSNCFIEELWQLLVAGHKLPFLNCSTLSNKVIAFFRLMFSRKKYNSAIFNLAKEKEISVNFLG